MPHRGKPNEPKMVAYVASRIAELRGMDPAEIAAVTRANYFRLFAIA
jgi:TatD DNase family protein